MSSDKNPLVIFTPSGKRGYFPVGTPVLQAARALGVDLDSVCGGRGICSKCQITPAFGEFSKHGVVSNENALSEWNSVEERYDRIRGLPKGRRLGCQAQILQDVVIDVPPESQVHKQVVRKRAEARQITMEPATKLYYVEVQEPDMHEPSGDVERICLALKEQWDLDVSRVETPILGKVQQALRKGDWKVTIAVYLDTFDGAPVIMNIWPGYYEGQILGMAVDLGSTTIAAHLCDLQTGEVLESAGQMNPQIRFGEDLMSRVSYSMMNPGGAAEMTRVVREALRQLATTLAETTGHTTDDIYEMVLVANPVMHHLLLGIDPVELGQAPFALATSHALKLAARDLDLAINPSARVYILPCIAGHVGADAAAVTLSEAPEKREDLSLIIDVGTNAEIQLGNNKRLLACSSPTGPAFEGAQISSGQRAAPGAIERAEIDPVSKICRFRVIGNEAWSDQQEFMGTRVTGICGSGIIELVAEMRIAGIVDGNGLIGSPEQVGSDLIIADGRTWSYTVFDGRETGGPLVTVTNKDIREIQLAKAALYAGARLLMDKFEVDAVDRIVLAGAFGAHISPKHAMVLGMIPDGPIESVTSAGNAAGTGARIALLNMSARREIEETVTKIEKIETALEPRFQEHFVDATNIPNATAPFATLRSIVTLPDVNFNAGSGDNAGGNRRRRRG